MFGHFFRFFGVWGLDLSVWCLDLSVGCLDLSSGCLDLSVGCLDLSFGLWRLKDAHQGLQVFDFGGETIKSNGFPIWQIPKVCRRTKPVVSG